LLIVSSPAATSTDGNWFEVNEIMMILRAGFQQYLVETTEPPPPAEDNDLVSGNSFGIERP
jgi:hypothetical protein